MIATMLITLILRVAILECLVFVYLEVIKMTESLQNQDDVLNEIEIVLIGTKKGTGIHTSTLPSSMSNSQQETG